jgi:hypothetical protein
LEFAAPPDRKALGLHARVQKPVGEAENLAVLTRGEWNVLVDLIQSGTLSKA